MPGLLPTLTSRHPLSLLCLGAHGDDIEIGCGGTVLRFLEEHPGSSVHWIVFSATGVRGKEAHSSANLFLQGAGKSEIVIGEFKDGFFPYIGGEVKQFFEQLKQKVSPDLILTHQRHDLHQDHRLISELTWNTFRNHLILEYEIVKYDGDLGSPNFFVHLSEAICRRKVDYVVNCFDSQREKSWFSKDTFYAMYRLRGLESNAPEKYAEAFYCRKMIY